ncbi:MAG: hypothetical protein LBD41_00660, partial [Clostridiales Family XIII bacterium]|nr:hypothetical protein [Clostridiales Family XIII bacterium]
MRKIIVKRMGSGKTREALFSIPDGARVLIVAPVRIVESVYSDEIRKWGLSLNFKVANGCLSSRIGVLTDLTYTAVGISCDSLWRTPIKYASFFNFLIVDEITFFKTPTAKRSKAVYGIAEKFNDVIGLTGTVITNSELDLYGISRAVGYRLFCMRSFYAFRRAFFYPQATINGVPVKWKLQSPIYRNKILEEFNNIADIDLTDIVGVESEEHIRYVGVSPEYKVFKKEHVIEAITGDIVAETAVKLFIKLCQMTSGFIYDEERRPQYFTSEKLEELERIINENEGQNILVYT